MASASDRTDSLSGSSAGRTCASVDLRDRSSLRATPRSMIQTAMCPQQACSQRRRSMMLVSSRAAWLLAWLFSALLEGCASNPADHRPSGSGRSSVHPRRRYLPHPGATAAELRHRPGPPLPVAFQLDATSSAHSLRSPPARLEPGRAGRDPRDHCRRHRLSLRRPPLLGGKQGRSRDYVTLLDSGQPGGIDRFLLFIRQELIPHIDGKYRTDPSARALSVTHWVASSRSTRCTPPRARQVRRFAAFWPVTLVRRSRSRPSSRGRGGSRRRHRPCRFDFTTRSPAMTGRSSS